MVVFWECIMFFFFFLKEVFLMILIMSSKYDHYSLPRCEIQRANQAPASHLTYNPLAAFSAPSAAKKSTICVTLSACLYKKHHGGQSRVESMQALCHRIMCWHVCHLLLGDESCWRYRGWYIGRTPLPVISSQHKHTQSQSSRMCCQRTFRSQTSDNTGCKTQWNDDIIYDDIHVWQVSW